ncbi:FAD-binding protein [Eggerthella sp. YY7918]|uniref:FAD-dependent oxidoreductase n=1 Tax=Eggerthella sp. (strain YY7918) TaxID=502558 RepID=UPI0003092259|nr:FAD-binding protein [Eggerthella sp. YY7918]
MERRDFLKVALASGTVAAAGSFLYGCSPTSKEDAKKAAESSVSAPQGAITSDILGQKWAFEIAPDPITDDQIAETIEADIVVVGAGISGLVTANSAIEEGAKVVVVSASENPVSRGGSNNAVYSKAMEAAGLPRTDVWDYQKEIFYGANNVDTKKWYRYYNNSETAMNWAIDLMAEAGYECGIERTTPVDKDSLFAIPATSHGWMTKDVRSPAMGQPFFAEHLAKRLTDMGGQIYFKNIGKQLVRGDAPNGTDGRVTAVIAQREDDTFAKYVGTKAVVLATGDFSGNRDMMAKYCPTFYDSILEDIYDSEPNYDAGFQYGGLFKGEGQQMGLWVGAAWQRSFPNCPMGGILAPGPNKSYSTHWGLMVDRNGERFMDEYCVSPVAGVTIALQDGKEASAIWDASYATHTGCWLGNLNDPPIGEELPDPTPEEMIAAWDKQVENGAYVKGDTIEDVVEQLGLPASTVETIKHYNEMAKAGEDTEFHKRADMLHEINTPPYYGQKTSQKSILTVLGGLRTNSYMQVCDAEDNPIPGLYNVGTMVGDVFSGNYSFMVCGANYGMNCITFGYLTGKYIVEHEKA